MTIVGGLRSRLVFDSVANAIKDGMAELGWFDVGRAHKPITFLTDAISADEEVQLTTVALIDGSTFDTEAEMGNSRLSETSYSFYLDIYAEAAALGRALANDVRDLIMGRHGGRTGATIAIYDYQIATPTQFGYVEVERISIFREPNPSKPWEKNWFTVRFEVIDYYSPED